MRWQIITGDSWPFMANNAIGYQILERENQQNWSKEAERSGI